jgi:hypothetical protein
MPKKFENDHRPALLRGLVCPSSKFGSPLGRLRRAESPMEGSVPEPHPLRRLAQRDTAREEAASFNEVDGDTWPADAFLGCLVSIHAE